MALNAFYIHPSSMTVQAPKEFSWEMRFGAIANAIRDTALAPAAIKVFLLYVEMADSAGEAAISGNVLAHMAGVVERSAIFGRRQLIKRRHLVETGETRCRADVLRVAYCHD